MTIHGIPRKLIRKQLLTALSKRESAGLAELLSKMKKNLGSNETFISAARTSLIFGAIHLKLFGSYQMNEIDYVNVMENLDKVKAMLAEVPLKNFKKVDTKKPKSKSSCPGMPSKVIILNGRVGRVCLTAHAWKRFYQRICLEEPLPADEIVLRLRRSFLRANPIDLRVSRFYDSKYSQPCRNYLDELEKCLFVVQRAGQRRLLVTVKKYIPLT